MDPGNPLDALLPEERTYLQSLGFDAAQFSALAAGLQHGTLPPNGVDGIVEAPGPGDIVKVAPPGSLQGDALRDAGAQLIHDGRVALLLLNGGMATRFGGIVKGVVNVLPGRSFLALHGQRLATAAGASGPGPALMLMNSNATDPATQEHLDATGQLGLSPDRLRTFLQTGAPRLRPDGSLYRDAEGAVSIYGPGHGDLLSCLRTSGSLRWAQERGIEYLIAANVDNLGATIDPALLGHFAASGSEMLVEVVTKGKGDVGGCPARVGGRLCIVEGFAFPPSFDQSRISVFNTNTLWFRVDALDRDLPLRWYTARKTSNGDPVVQFERLVGQASWFLDTAFVNVPRGRFLPVKRPEDLEAVRAAIRGQLGVRLQVLGGP